MTPRGLVLARPLADWLDGAAWASPKGAERGTTQQTIHDAPKLARGERYVVRVPFEVQGGSPDQPGYGAGTAYCDDLDDVAVSRV